MFFYEKYASGIYYKYFNFEDLNLIVNILYIISNFKYNYIK